MIPAPAGRTPAYLAIADELAAGYAALPPGTLVDSEHQIAERFTVNRLTAREVLRELERRLIVRREVGRGTFTTFRIEYPVEVGGAASFQANVAAAGHTITPLSVVLTSDGDEVVLRRVSAVDGFVAVTGDDRFPAAVGELIGERVADGGSIRAALESVGYSPRRQSTHVSVAVPPPDVGARLGFSGSPPPTWRLRSVTVDALGVVIDRSDGWLRTDMFDVHVRVGG